MSSIAFPQKRTPAEWIRQGVAFRSIQLSFDSYAFYDGADILGITENVKTLVVLGYLIHELVVHADPDHRIHVQSVGRYKHPPPGLEYFRSGRCLQ